MPYILKRTDSWGGYVAMPGSKKAYTNKKSLARRFPTREDANTDRCIQNEIVMEYTPDEEDTK